MPSVELHRHLHAPAMEPLTARYVRLFIDDTDESDAEFPGPMVLRVSPDHTRRQWIGVPAELVPILTE